MLADEPITLELPDILRKYIRNGLRRTRTCMPARVEVWHPESQTVDVQPLVRTIYHDRGEEVVVDTPMITRVPIAVAAWGGFIDWNHPEPGDILTLVIADRELETWLLGDGSMVTPKKDYRMHSADDAIAMPGIVPVGQPYQGGGDDRVIGLADGNGEIRIGTDGHISLGARDAAKRPVARRDDAVDAATTMDTWIGAVSSFINGMVPGTVTPPLDFGVISEGSDALDSE